MKCSPCCGRCAASCKHVVNISGSAMQPRDGVLAASCVKVHQRLTAIREMCICINELGHQTYQHGVAAFFFLSCMFLEVADAASCMHH